MRYEINIDGAITEHEDAPIVEIPREDLIHRQIQDSKQYLQSTDFYMTVDKYAELSENRKVELTTKRAEARELINTLEAELGNI